MVRIDDTNPEDAWCIEDSPITQLANLAVRMHLLDGDYQPPVQVGLERLLVDVADLHDGPITLDQIAYRLHSWRKRTPDPIGRDALRADDLAEDIAFMREHQTDSDT